MSKPTTLPTVPFTNSLDFGVRVYDSFSAQSTTSQGASNRATNEQGTSNYFGTLTLLATVPAKSTSPVRPIHDSSVLIVSNAKTNAPVARLLCSKLLNTTPLGVGPADVKAMAQTMEFIAFITEHPNDPLTVVFNNLWRDSSKPVAKLVSGCFARHPKYSSCTFATYMMGTAIAAEEPASKAKPLEQAAYSLSHLVKLLGGNWPANFPDDIVISKFTCNTKHDVLEILAEIDLDKLPAQSDQALRFFGSLFKVKQLFVTLEFNYGFGTDVFGTRLAISLDTMHVPFGNSGSLTINKPTATIDINPLSKDVVFTVVGSIPFNIFGKVFEADVSMLVDNLEANFGVVIKGDNTSLPAPPVMQGVHFDQFGVGIGIVFEPPGAVIGLSGKLHIGQPLVSEVDLADDTFVVVCQLVEEVPNPLYISFYVPQMRLDEVLTVFTNAQSAINVPVQFTDMSFKWSEKPTEAVALPDGSLSNMGYGFSAAATILTFGFYGDVEIDLNHGLTADIEMAPMTLGSVFTMGGNGTGVTINVDASGNPIKNNQLPTTVAQQQALKAAATKQLVVPGGPVLKLQTITSPYLHLDGRVSLFEVANEQLSAEITTSGIAFEVNYGTLLTTTMSCILSDYHNLSGSFQFGVNQTIPLPSIAGVSLGALPLQVTASVQFTLSTSSSTLTLQVKGSINFEGLDRSFGFSADANIQKVTDLLFAIVIYIQQTAMNLFSDLLSNGAAWAGKVKQGVIIAMTSVAHTLQVAYDQSADQIAATMHDAGYGIGEIAEQLKIIFDPGQVATALKDAFGYSASAVAQVMSSLGYAGDDVARALNTAFAGDIGVIAPALQGAYHYTAEQISGILGNIGFTPSQIGQSFQSLGGDFQTAGNAILHVFGCCLM